MSFRYPNAKYMTIAETIARKLRAGEFLSEGRFYSRDELARAYHISPGTARAVLRVLEDRGVIACRKGKRSVPVRLADDRRPVGTARPVFFRDSRMAETPEYDYLTYCVRNLLMRHEAGFLERGTDDADAAAPQAWSPGDVAVVFPSAGGGGDGKKPPQTAVRVPDVRIDLLVDQARSNAVSLFTRKASLDCILHLIRHEFAAVVHVAAKNTAAPWFGSVAAPGVLEEYAAECRTETVLFDDEPEMFPDFLSETVSRCEARGHGPVAILIDDPCLSDFMSGEMRTGLYRPPSHCSFFGTAFSERSMMFPFLDLRLDVLAEVILRTVFAKAENPAAGLACDFHLYQFRVPGFA